MMQEQEKIQTLKTKIRDFVQMYTQLVGDQIRITGDDNRIIALLNALAEDNTITDNAIKAYQRVVGKIQLIISFKYTKTVVIKKGGWFGTDETQEQPYEPGIVISLHRFHTELRNELRNLEEAEEDQNTGKLKIAQETAIDATKKAKLEKKARKEIEKKAEDEKRDAEYKLRKQELEMLAQSADEKKVIAEQALLIGAGQVLQLVMDVISHDRQLTDVVHANYGGTKQFEQTVMVRWQKSSTNGAQVQPPVVQETNVVQPESEMDKCKNYFGAKFGEVIRLIEMHDDQKITGKEKLLIQYLLFQLAYHKSNKSVSEIATEAKTFFVDVCSLNADVRILGFLDDCLKNPEVMVDADRKELSMDECASIVRRLRCENEPFLPKDEKAREVFALKHKFLKSGGEYTAEATEIGYKNHFMQNLALLSPRVTLRRLATGFWKSEAAASASSSANSDKSFKH